MATARQKELTRRMDQLVREMEAEGMNHQQIQASFGSRVKAAAAAPPTMTVDQTTFNVSPGGSPITIIATVANTTAVPTWTLSPATGVGTIAVNGGSCIYTPPASSPTQATEVTITATLTTGAGVVTRTVVGTVESRIPSMTLSHSSIVVEYGDPAFDITANVVNSDLDPTWEIQLPTARGSLNSPTNGTNTARGDTVKYYPPVGGSVNKTATLTVTLAVSPPIVVTIPISCNNPTVTDPPPTATPTLSVSPSPYSATPGSAAKTFTATLTNSTSAITWSLSPATGKGTISTTSGATTVYTPPATGTHTATLTATAGTLEADVAISIAPAGARSEGLLKRSLTDYTADTGFNVELLNDEMKLLAKRLNQNNVKSIEYAEYGPAPASDYGTQGEVYKNLDREWLARAGFGQAFATIMGFKATGWQAYLDNMNMLCGCARKRMVENPTTQMRWTSSKGTKYMIFPSDGAAFQAKEDFWTPSLFAGMGWYLWVNRGLTAGNSSTWGSYKTNAEFWMNFCKDQCEARYKESKGDYIQYDDLMHSRMGSILYTHYRYLHSTISGNPYCAQPSSYYLEKRNWGVKNFWRSSVKAKTFVRDHDNWPAPTSYDYQYHSQRPGAGYTATRWEPMMGDYAGQCHASAQMLALEDVPGMRGKAFLKRLYANAAYQQFDPGTHKEYNYIKRSSPDTSYSATDKRRYYTSEIVTVAHSTNPSNAGRPYDPWDNAEAGSQTWQAQRIMKDDGTYPGPTHTFKNVSGSNFNMDPDTHVLKEDNNWNNGNHMLASTRRHFPIPFHCEGGQVQDSRLYRYIKEGMGNYTFNDADSASTKASKDKKIMTFFGVALFALVNQKFDLLSDWPEYINATAKV